MANGMAPMGFLSPFRDLLDRHAVTFASHLATIASELGSITDNTAAQLASENRMRATMNLTKNNEVQQLVNKSGHAWLVKMISSPGLVEVFLGGTNPENFVFKTLAALPQATVDIYVPPNGVLFCINKAEAVTSVNCEVLLLDTAARQGYTGPSGEAIEVERRPQAPPTMPFIPGNRP